MLSRSSQMLCWLIFSLMCASSGCSLKTQLSVPPLLMTTTYIGTVFTPETKSCSVTIRNASSKDIYVKRIVPSCGCTKVAAQSFVIKGESSFILPFTYNSSGKSGPQQVGFYIFANGYPEPIRLKSAANVIPVIPRDISLSPARADAIFPTIVVLHRRLLGRSLKVHVISYDQGLLGLIFKPTANGDVELDVSPQRAAIGREFGTDLHIATNDMFQPDAHITIHGQVLPYLTSDPEIISLGIVHKGDSPVVTVQIRSPYDHKFRITSATSSDNRIQLKIIPTTSSVQNRVALHLVQPLRPGDLNALVKVHTNDLDQEAISIPVYGIIAN